MSIYVCGGKMFGSLTEASEYANFIHLISGYILGIEEYKR